MSKKGGPQSPAASLELAPLGLQRPSTWRSLPLRRKARSWLKAFARDVYIYIYIYIHIYIYTYIHIFIYIYIQRVRFPFTYSVIHLSTWSLAFVSEMGCRAVKSSTCEQMCHFHAHVDTVLQPHDPA